MQHTRHDTLISANRLDRAGNAYTVWPAVGTLDSVTISVSRTGFSV